MSETELDRIERIRQRAEIDAATPEWSAGDWSFHEALCRPSGHDRQIETIPRDESILDYIRYGYI
jgi:DNA-binding GntR family transcriptional regulator